ncbi:MULTISPECIES: hypothetical protein [unclassified Micromonospora]|uniref:hypothetical protein n=1 Tax=unclassified Micromonospora TaxID=2617518 RepID=UPI002E1A8D71|nr:hypothetical protein OG990_05810 [Micromonospora sp. NBC_00858]
MERTHAAHAFREAAQSLVDLVLTEDMVYFDGLPDRVDRELGTPLAGLGSALSEGRELSAILDMARLVEEIADEIRPSLPEDLASAISDMATARRDVD